MPSFKESKALHYSSGMKYRLNKAVYHKIKNDLGLKKEFVHPDKLYALRKDSAGQWWLIGYAKCGWDGATLYPDYPWMMYPSFVHDVLLWLIRRGLIDPKYNDAVDRELFDVIMDTDKVKIPFYLGGNALRGFHARKVMRGTNLCDTKVGGQFDFERHVLEVR